MWLTSLVTLQSHVNSLACCLFNAHQSELIGSRFFGYNSPAAAAREVFKPSTDSASLVVPGQKKFFSFGLGVVLGVRHKWGCFAFSWHFLTVPGRPSNGPTLWIKYFYETRLSHESLEPLIGFLAYLDQTVRQKSKKWSKFVPLKC